MTTPQTCSRQLKTSAPKLLAASLTILLALLAAACGGSDSSDNGDSAAVADSDGSTDEAPKTLFFAGDFEPACRGIGIEAASAYVPGDGINQLVVLAGEDPSYDTQMSGALADGWDAPFETIEETELVACANRVSTTEGQLCEGYEDDESGISWSIQTYGADYDVTLRDAKTAEVVAESSFSEPAGDCPMFSFYSESGPQPQPDYATPDDALQAWLAEYVNA